MYQNHPASRLPLFLRSFLSSFFIFVLCSGIVLQANAQTIQTTQRSVYTRVDANIGGFLESLPNDYANNPTKKYPLIIFMHGVGERGNGSPGLLEKVANVGIAKLLKNSMFPASFTSGGKSFSFIVLSPQFETQNNWSQGITDLIAYAQKNYRVDESRIYLTGLSLGGDWGWIFTTSSVAHGQQLAASLLICTGSTATATQLANLKTSQVPIWVTHNSGDPYLPVSGATAMVNAINTVVVAPNKALLTIFNKIGHDAWTATYDPNFKQNGLNVYEWMLSKTRGSQPNPGTPVLTANAGADQTITLPTNTVTLDASGSKVTSGTITSYSWTKVSGPSTGLLTLVSNGLQAKLTALVAGTYVYQLTVKDSNGSTATDNVTVIVNAAGTSTDPPTVNAGLGQTITLPTSSATLDGSLSKASAGNTIVSYKWTKTTTSPAGGDITSPNSVKTTIINLIAGTYTYSLTVTDSRGSTKTGGTQIIVKSGTTSTDPPTVNAGLGQTITLPTSSATLDGSLSKASAGNTIVSYKWTKTTTSPAGGDITSPNSVKTTVSNLIAGTYTYSLAVTDSRGSTRTGGTQIIVNPGTTSSTPPTAKVVSELINVTLPANSAILDGSPSVAATGNTIKTYYWEKYTGPSYDGIQTPTSAKITVTGLVAGSYGFILTVTDNNGKTSSTDVSVIVSTASTIPPTAKVVASQINLTLPTNSATLDGSPSVAAAGNSIKSYYWNKYTGPTYNGIQTPTSAKITVTGLVAGSYGFTLTVTDNNGKTSSTDVAVIVKAAGSARVASAETATTDATLSNGRTLNNTLFEANITPNIIPSSTMNLRLNGTSAGKTSVLVYNTAGQLQLQQEFTKDAGSINRQVNISKLPAGIYVVQIIIDGKHKKVLRFVKQ